MLKLYYAPRTRAGRVRWLLEELGEPYELVRPDIAAKQNHGDDYLARVHPLGHVPALTDGDTTIFESAGICCYLADKHLGKGLAPPTDSAERGLYFQWIFFAMSELEPEVARYAANTHALSTEKHDPDAAESARVAFAKGAQVIARALERRPFLLGDALTTADVIVGGVLFWARMLKLLADAPALLEYVARLQARPAYRRATAD